MRDVANAMGMEYANFHARVIGRTRFKAAEMSALLREVPDLRLCDLLLRDTPFVAVRRPDIRRDPGARSLQQATRLATETVAAIGQLGKAAEQGYLEPSAYTQLVLHVAEAERSVAGLRASLIELMPVNRANTPQPGRRHVAVDGEPFHASVSD